MILRSDAIHGCGPECNFSATAIFFDCDGVPIKEPSLQEVLSAADVKLNRSKIRVSQTNFLKEVTKFHLNSQIFNSILSFILPFGQKQILLQTGQPWFFFKGLTSFVRIA